MTDKKKNTYLKGKIYKIINEIDDEIYVGSTCNPLSKRMYDHKGNINRKKETIKLYKHMDKLDFDNFEIILVENYPCKSKDELNAREEYWRKQLKATLNMKMAFMTEEERKESKKRDKYIIKAKNYYEEHRDDINEKHK